ncbi:hypothetical protein E3H11_02720 [Bradyrhizobium brasilense]|nr:hypothetical protein [Bradyrhizobium brasilense]
MLSGRGSQRDCSDAGGVDIGPQHSRSIVRESAGGYIKEKPELSPALRLQLERLPKTEAPDSAPSGYDLCSRGSRRPPGYKTARPKRSSQTLGLIVLMS